MGRLLPIHAVTLAVGAGLVVLALARTLPVGTGPPPGRAALRPPAELLFCVTPTTLCVGQALPAGFPCSCPHPLRGTQRGEILTKREAERILSQRLVRRLEAEDGAPLLGPP